jgi:ribonuclease E
MKRMLFNATQAEELRVAIVDGQKLIDLDIESAAKEQRKSNIYKGVITRIEPSLEACFVNYGEERHGFLPFKEVSRSYFSSNVDAGRAKISEALREGQEILVQIDKDERGNKGAALTTFISLAGRYLVLMPNNPRGGGVSRRVEGDERAELRDVIDQLEVPAGMSLIARTAAIGRSYDELQWDMNYLLQLWSAIDGASNQQSGPFLIYLEGSLVIRAIRDYFHSEIGEILIDTDDIYEQARAFMSTVMPANVNRVKRYRDDVPLFSRFQIEHQIESAYARQVNLPSGGAIVIDHTEALVAVDVNSGRATKGSDIEETALRTNQEAADEIARQLRLRDLGGLIVIDFIDMESQKNQRDVENRLREGLRYDRARVQMGKISRFGLMELSRQRLRPALAETSYIPCPRCTGTGHIRSTESAALHILRILEEEAMKDNTGAVHTQVPVDVATFLLNEKRADVAAIEQRHKVNILLIPNVHLETPQHVIERLKHDDLNAEDRSQPSYRMAEQPEQQPQRASAAAEAAKPRQVAAIRQFIPDQPAPLVPEKSVEPVAPVKSGGLFSLIAGWFKREPKEAAPVAVEVASKPKARSGRDGRRGSRRDEESRGGRREPSRGEQKQVVQERGEVAGQRESKEVREPKDSNRKQQPRRDNRGDAARPEPVEGKRPANPRSERGERGERQKPLVAPLADTTLPATEVIETAADDGRPTTQAAAVGQESGGRGRRGRRGRRGERRVEGETGSVAENVSVSPELAAEDVRSSSPEVSVAAGSHLLSDSPVSRGLPSTNDPVEALAVPAEINTSSVAGAEDSAIQRDQRVAPIEAAPVSINVTRESVASDPARKASSEISIPAVSIDEILKNSGMTLVETSHSPSIVSQREAAPRPVVPRRPRPTIPPAAEEPLCQIETKK